MCHSVRVCIILVFAVLAGAAAVATGFFFAIHEIPICQFDEISR